MRVGVIGCSGSIGARHVRNLREMGHIAMGADPLTPCDPGPALWSPTLAGVLAHQPQAVMICTPASTHADVAKDLKWHGYRGPLFVEKPLALSTAECDVFDAWPSPVTMVGYMLRFHPLVAAVKQMGFTGGRFIVRCDMRAWPGAHYGPAVYELSHEIDLAFYLGAGDAVVAPYYRGPVAFNYADGSTVELDGYCGDYDRTWMVSTPGGHIRASFSRPGVLGDQMYVDELAHFLACVEKNEPTITPFADGIRVVKVCEQAPKLAEASA